MQRVKQRLLSGGLRSPRHAGVSSLRSSGARPGDWAVWGEHLLQPSGEITIQRVPALIKAVPAPGVEDQLLRLARAGVKVTRAPVRQHLVGAAVDEHRRLGA